MPRSEKSVEPSRTSVSTKKHPETSGFRVLEDGSFRPMIQFSMHAGAFSRRMAAAASSTTTVTSPWS